MYPQSIEDEYEEKEEGVRHQFVQRRVGAKQASKLHKIGFHGLSFNLSF